MAHQWRRSVSGRVNEAYFIVYFTVFDTLSNALIFDNVQVCFNSINVPITQLITVREQPIFQNGI